VHQNRRALLPFQFPETPLLPRREFCDGIHADAKFDEVQRHAGSPAKRTNIAPSAIARNAVRNAVLPDKVAQIAILLRNFYRVNAGSCAA
jgi:hypothetical protein